MKYLHICPVWDDYYDLGRKKIIQDHEIIFYSFEGRGLDPIMCDGIGKMVDDFEPQATLDELDFLCEELQVDAVTSSTDYPGSLLASFLSHRRGYVGIDPAIMLGCQHKYHSRCWQQQIVPEATPEFMLFKKGEKIGSSFCFPLFIKPVKSRFSIFAQCARDQAELDKLCESMCIPQRFFDQFNWFLPGGMYPLSSDTFLAEQYLTGIQVTLEGYVFDHQMYSLGIVDSVMFPDTICFKRFEYPSKLDQSVQERMMCIAQKFMTAIGFNNGLFNVEFIYNPMQDTIHIIEVNPRMGRQFVDLFEKVDGTNTFEIMLALGIGQRPIVNKRKGKYSVAASFVLRTFENKTVIATPTDAEKETVLANFPDARLHILVKEGMKLSDITQDGKSYRYGLIHLGARDYQELYEKYEAVLKQLTFKFA